MGTSDCMLRSASSSLRKLAQEEDVRLATAHKAVQEKLQLFPYNLTELQQLKSTDHEKRIRYCEWFKNFIQTKTGDILDVTFFTYEACSTPRVMFTHKTQHKLGSVGCDIYTAHCWPCILCSNGVPKGEVLPKLSHSQFRGIYIRNNLIRIWVSIICKLSGTLD
jgi:hypothetical protein